MQFLDIILDTIHQNGGQAKFVGGLVRDFLIEAEPPMAFKDYLNERLYTADIDIATDLTPEEINLIFNNLAKFRVDLKITIKRTMATNLVIINGVKTEITTLRRDVKCDGRRAEFEYTRSFKEDAERRDFTINAFYADLDGTIYDFFNGRADLQNKLVKFIGDPNRRIQEDYLRILRFFRFCAKFNASFHKESLLACKANLDGYDIISKERIRQEFFKLLEYPLAADFLLKMHQEGLLESLVKTHIDNRVLTKLQVLHIGTESIFATYFALTERKPEASITLSREEIRFVNIYRANFELLNSLDTANLLYLRMKFGDKIAQNLWLVYYLSTDISYENYQKIYPQDVEIPDFPLDGNDLLGKDLPPKLIGELLEYARMLWIRSNFALLREDLLVLIHKKLID